MTGVVIGGAAASSEFSALRAAYERDGFVNGGRVFSDADLDIVSEDLERIADSVVRGASRGGPTPAATQWGPGHFQIVSPRQVQPSFDVLINHQPMLRMAAALAKTSLLQLWSDVVHYKAPLTGGIVNWHQDGASHREVRPARRVISVWIALDDADEESGCMWMAPGSHRWGRQEEYLRMLKRRGEPLLEIKPPDSVPIDQWRGVRPCPVRRGEVHFHHALTWHGSPENRSARRRRGYTMFLMPSDICTTDANKLGLPGGAPLTDAAAQRPIVYRAQSLRD
jgi:phytanoyl-CoA hydroxylase